MAVRAHSYTNILSGVSNWVVLGKRSQRFLHDHIPQTFATFQPGITHIRLCCSHLFRAFNHLFETWVCNVSRLTNEITFLVDPRRWDCQRVKGEQGELEAPDPRIQVFSIISAQYLVRTCCPLKGCCEWNLFMIRPLYCRSFTSSVGLHITSRHTTTKQKTRKTSDLRNWDGTSQPKHGENPSNETGWKKHPDCYQLGWLVPVLPWLQQN